MSKLSKKIIGITGNIACGKSMVTDYLAAKGYYIIDADIITKELYESNEEFKEALLNLFGNEILVDNKINKSKVSEIVFKEVKLLEKLNAVAHPLILKKTKQLIDDSSDTIIFVSAALLFEAKWDEQIDKVILVKCDQAIQIQRLKKRNNLSLDEALKRINSQMPQDEKALLSDYIIENNSDVISLYKEIEKILIEIEKVK